ncbi:MAG TPA: tRNA pseudouridine(55) synthase TruB [Polyangiaceae bacterium]|nr:tRNA pseudouridine(55) synthase TruB [Polyangiaceae bacterium]
MTSVPAGAAAASEAGRSPAPCGVLVLDKPQGPTSHDVVGRVRRALGTRAVGHAGTLDPMATGTLVLAVGEATKLVPWLTAQDKAYEATIALGVETDTLDADGRPVRAIALAAGLLEELRGGGDASALVARAIALERARTEQVPPAFSAIHHDGERAYAMARRGEAPSLAARPVVVHDIEVTACGDDPPLVHVRLDVGKGYYVRALARDLAEALGTVGHLTSLRRIRSGGFSCEDAAPAHATRDELLARMLPAASAAARVLPVAKITDAGARDARHGRTVHPHDIDGPAGGPTAWIDPGGRLVAVGRVDDAGRGAVLRGFVGG